MFEFNGFPPAGTGAESQPMVFLLEAEKQNCALTAWKLEEECFLPATCELLVDAITPDVSLNHHRTWVLSKDSRARVRVNTGIPLLNVGSWAGVTITLLASRMSSLFFVTGVSLWSPECLIRLLPQPPED